MHTTSTTDLPPVKDLTAIAAENDPNRVAFGDGADGRTLTWAALDARSNRAANAFREHVAQGDRVAFLCENSVDHVTLWNGALKAGCVVSNLHVRASPATTRYCVDALRPRVLVVDEDFSEFAAERVLPEVTTDLDAVVAIGEPRDDHEQSLPAFLDGRAETEPDVRVREDDLAAVWWTSGTTGRPKGWCHTNRTLAIKGLKMVSPLHVDRNARALQVFTPSFGAWYASTLPLLFANGSSYFLRKWDAADCLRTIEVRGLTNATLVTTMWRDVLRRDDLEDYDLTSLEHVVSTGERLDPTTLERLEERICENVGNGYAATEVMGTTMPNADMVGDRVESVGQPIPGTRVRVVEPGGAPDDEVAPGEVGEIVIKAADAAVWAWGNTAKTEAVFTDGWWYSGDLGYRDEDGYLFLSGRKDLMITSKGTKVYPVPVEERLNAHPSVEEAAVVGVEDEEYGEMVTGVVRRADPDLTAEELDEWCLESDGLARFERPREYRFVDEPLPRTASGKLDRLAARERSGGS